MSHSMVQAKIHDLTVTGKIVPEAGATIIQSGLCYPKTTVTTLTSGATVTYTAAQILGGLITDTISAGCAATLPAPASIVAAINGAVVGTSFDVVIKNTAASAITITVTANGASTIVGTATITQNNSKMFKGIISNVTPGSEAVAFYSLGMAAF